MKAPITPAQVWAVIAESAGWNEKELPVLPNFPHIPPIEQRGAWIKWGQQCAAHAREAALEEVIERVQGCDWDRHELRELIQNMKAVK